jgi:hypothetical protein
MDILDGFQKLVSTRRTISISISIGLDCRDHQGYVFVMEFDLPKRRSERWTTLRQKKNTKKSFYQNYGKNDLWKIWWKWPMDWKI